MRHEEIPLPDWFPELSIGEHIYVRFAVDKHSAERWISARVSQISRDPQTPNIIVRLDNSKGADSVRNNVIHLDDPRLDDPVFVRDCRESTTAPSDGVFVLAPTRLRTESRLARLEADNAELKRQVRSLLNQSDDAEPTVRRRRREAATA